MLVVYSMICYLTREVNILGLKILYRIQKIGLIRLFKCMLISLRFIPCFLIVVFLFILFFIPKLIPFDPTDIYYFMIKVQGVHKSLTKYDF